MKKDPYAKEGHVYILNTYTGCPVYCTSAEYAAMEAEEKRRQKEDRLHILEGFLIAFENMDVIVKTITEAMNKPEIREKLMGILSLSSKQVSAILQMKLKKLQRMNREAVKEEYLSLRDELSQKQRV